jgi:hypothetical protein
MNLSHAVVEGIPWPEALWPPETVKARSTAVLLGSSRSLPHSLALMCVLMVQLLNLTIHLWMVGSSDLMVMPSSLQTFDHMENRNCGPLSEVMMVAVVSFSGIVSA